MCCPHKWAETATVLLLLSLHACAVTALKDYQLIRDFANPEDGINYRFCDAATRNASPCEARHRSCLIAEMTADSTTVVCGPCQLGYIGYGFYDDGNPVCAPIDTLKYPKYEHRFGVAMNDAMKTEQTYTERAEVLKDAARFIASHNNQIWVNGEWSVGNDTDLPWKHREFMLGLTPYSADSTPEDYRSRSGYVYVNVTGTENELKAFNATEYVQSQNTRSLQQWASSSESLPDRFDWVEQGGVTHVKDQGRCGCCWAISLSGAIEGGIYADPSNNGYLQSLSFQQFISCSKVNDGCGGGNLALASVWSKINIFSGIASLNDYPYTDYFGKTTEECLTSPSAKTVTVEGNSPSSSDSNIPPAVQVGRAQRVAGFDAGLSQEQRIQAFKEALMVQPVGMVMKSACRTLSSYRRGVITDDGGCACGAPDCLDHAVLMVGYDDSGPVPYFKLKNSWGTMWGEDGYFRVAQSGGVGSYGLFGILAEGVVATGQNTTGMVEENIQQSPLKEWYTILILVLIGLCCLSSILAVIRKHCWCHCSSKEDRHLDDVSIDAEQAATR